MFKGRIGRLAYFLGWIYLILPMVLLLVVLLAAGGVSRAGHTGPAFSSIVSILVLVLDLGWLVFYLIAGFGLIIRRWHDLNQSGWLSLLQLIPLVSFVTALIQLFAPGTSGSNNYGDQPGSSLGFKTVLLGGGSGASSEPDPHFAALQNQSAPATPEQTPPPASPPPIQPQQTSPTPSAPPPPANPAPADTQGPSQPPSQ